MLNSQAEVDQLQANLNELNEMLGSNTIGVLRSTYTISGVPDYNYSIMGPKTLV